MGVHPPAWRLHACRPVWAPCGLRLVLSRPPSHGVTVLEGVRSRSRESNEAIAPLHGCMHPRRVDKVWSQMARRRMHQHRLQAVLDTWDTEVARRAVSLSQSGRCRGALADWQRPARASEPESRFGFDCAVRTGSHVFGSVMTKHAKAQTFSLTFSVRRYTLAVRKFLKYSCIATM